MSSIPPPPHNPAPPPGWYFHPESGAKKWWTGSHWLDARPKNPKTVPLAVFIVVTVVAFVVGIMAGSGGSSSELAAAKSRISQLEAQPTANAPQNVSGTPSAGPTASSTPIPAAVTLSGDGQMTSKKVALKGDYSVSWKTLGSCYYSATLKSGADSLSDPEAFTANHEASGTNNVYGLKAADYYLDVITGPTPSCGWTVTMMPVP
ncbi:hypothetical protein [Arthrobacter sp. 2MCAF14]|uniref:hypothetical protein n=1 Tax=Arthrobacter sp. 2MCAF14 TaxID=3232982 RepID=UPI003F8E101C